MFLVTSVYWVFVPPSGSGVSLARVAMSGRSLGAPATAPWLSYGASSVDGVRFY